MGIEYFHVMMSLSVVIALMLFLIFLIKKFKLSKYGANHSIKIVNVIPIGSKEKLMLVDVEDSRLLLGVTANHIETLYVFNQFEKTAQQTVFSEKVKTANLMMNMDEANLT